MRKKQRKVLQGLANEIDKLCVEHHGRKMTYHTVHSTPVSHEDMKLANQEPEEGKEYTFDMPMIHDVNHFRRLKRQLVKHGVDGVMDYLKKCGFAPENELLKAALA